MTKPYNYRWRQERIHFLQEQPLCRYCAEQGRITPATVVDHIIPHKNNHDLFWDKANWQPLCKFCHDSVKQREEILQKRVGCDISGFPLQDW